MQSHQQVRHRLRSGQAITSYDRLARSLISPHAQVHTFKLTGGFLLSSSRPHGCGAIRQIPWFNSCRFIIKSGPAHYSRALSKLRLSPELPAAIFRRYGARTAMVGIEQVPRP